ncbi:MAG: hypothetical protein ACI861_000700 [Paracoccaceae bacterium]|jgi:hypothetical protein
MRNLAKTSFATVALTLMGAAQYVTASEETHEVSNETIAAQRHELAENTDGQGFGPQSPRDIDVHVGNNNRTFEAAPSHTLMNLCNIHFHENAEHKGGEFTTFAGNGDGHGYGTGYKYSGDLSAAELTDLGKKIGESEYGDLVVGDTIEVHYVHTTAQINPGPTLGACLSEAIMNPQLRVETQVYVLVNDESALVFGELAKTAMINGLHQAVNIPTNTGQPVQYEGSTTGPGYNETGSPLQVSWSVRPQVAKVNIETLEIWLAGNIFDEDHAHGVRNLVVNPDLLSPID